MAEAVDGYPDFEEISLRNDEGPQGLPVCSICTDPLGTWGGPASLACGHNGCLECLQKVQKHSSSPLCPLCRTPFDANNPLGLNTDLQYAFDRALALEGGMKNAVTENPEAFSNQVVFIEQASARKHFVYDVPLQDETGDWIPVSVSPTRVDDLAGQEESGNFAMYYFPEDCTWLGHAAKGYTVPELTAWSLLSEVIAVACGAKRSKGRLKKQFEDKGTFFADQMGDHLRNMTAVLASEPPQWLPDSSSSICMQCCYRFNPITCQRHHCRFCGGIFCDACSTGRSLLPVKFRERSPQRVCDPCSERLAPVQGILLEQVSHAAQLATHDVTDLSCLRAWINSPVGLSLEHEIYKATNTLHSFSEVRNLKPEQGISDAVLKGAKGLAIITILKAGMMITYKLGTGLVVTKTRDGSWSAPSAITSCGIGWGAQAGGELTDFIIVLRNEAAIKAFCGRVHFSLGAGLSVAAGPLGRTVEADIRAGDGGTAACYTYSRSKGVFLGCSLEGSIVTTRTAVNTQFYGDPYLRTADILLGSVKQPKAAAPLYSALSDMFMNVCD